MNTSLSPETTAPQAAQEKKPWEVFIAHASGDAAAAKVLFDALLAAGCHPFLDNECLELGCDWDTEIASAQRASLITVVLVSKKTPGAYFAREEIQAAVSLARKAKTRHRVIPIWLDGPPDDDDEVVPYGLRLKHGVALTSEVTLQVVASRIARTLGRVTTGSSSPTISPVDSAPSLTASLPRSAWLIAIIVVAALAVRLLGQFAHDARESILGVPSHQTTYQEAELWRTGLMAVLGLLRGSLFDLWAGQGPERWGALVAAALIAGWLFLARSPFHRLSLVLVPASVLTLAVGVLLYATAVRLPHVAVPDRAGWICEASRTPTERISFEVCSWLWNGSTENGYRRGALEGLWGWLFAATCVMGACSVKEWRRRNSGEQLRVVRLYRVLGATCALTALFLLGLAPWAYAIGTWGLKYPRVVDIAGQCLPDLREALRSGECQAWDVSAGARQQVLLLASTGCPSSPSSGPLDRFLVLTPAERERCAVQIGTSEVISGTR